MRLPYFCSNFFFPCIFSSRETKNQRLVLQSQALFPPSSFPASPFHFPRRARNQSRRSSSGERLPCHRCRASSSGDRDEAEAEAALSPPPPSLSEASSPAFPFLLLCLPKTLLSTAAAPKTTQLLLMKRYRGSATPLHSSATTKISCAGRTLNRSHGSGYAASVLNETAGGCQSGSAALGTTSSHPATVERSMSMVAR